MDASPDNVWCIGQMTMYSTSYQTEILQYTSLSTNAHVAFNKSCFMSSTDVHILKWKVTCSSFPQLTILLFDDRLI